MHKTLLFKLFFLLCTKKNPRRVLYDVTLGGYQVLTLLALSNTVKITLRV